MHEGVAQNAEHIQGRPWRTYVNSRRFAWLNLACALVAGALWYLSNGRAGPWPLMIAGLPWLARLVSGHFPLPRSRFDPLIAGFVLSAIVGVWTSFNQVIAWDKFWLIIGSVVIFYALAGQRGANLWPLLNGIALFGGAAAIFFVLTHDWTSLPAKIEFINQIGNQLASVRPAFVNNLNGPHPNVVGGILAMLFPLALAAGIRSVRKRHLLAAPPIILSIAAMGAGLLFTTSRASWLALVGGLGAWLLWVGAGQIAGSLYLSKRKTLGLGLFVIIGIGLSLSLLLPGGFVYILERLPGPPSVGSRLDISRGAIDLAGDFPITGGGLGSFDGLYSYYIQVIPHSAHIHAHNLYLNVTVEQGIIGTLMLVGIILLAFWFLSDPSQSARRRSISNFSLACGAIFASLVVMSVHGFGDDPLYSSRAILFLWLPLGIVTILFPRRKGWVEILRAYEFPLIIPISVLVTMSALLLILYQTPILGAWHASMGAIEMARVELADFPTGEWSEGREASLLASARARFEKALMFDRGNRTAWHRLGLISMLERDYETAKDDLYNAYLLDGGNRGIRKSLAYAYLWTGNLENAVPLLLQFPEAQQELATYRGWWSIQGQTDKSQLAEDAYLLLAERSAQQ